MPEKPRFVIVPRHREEPLRKSAFYVGPRGGRWADAKHTIPWKGPVQVKVHQKIGGGGDHEFHVSDAGEGKVRLSRGGKSDLYGPTMPPESVRHFVNDLAGKVEAPDSEHPQIQAVIEGKAKFLGKGDDGLAFKVGDTVVKVSTTVPFQPENQGHRSPVKAADMLKEQVDVGNELADAGVPGIQRSEFVKHGDKGFQIKPYVEIPEKFTREQLDEVQRTLIAMHKQGYSLNDEVQAGLHNDKPVMFDVGKATKMPPGEREGVYGPVTVDMDNMKRLYRDHGQEFVRLDQPEGQRALDRAKGRFDQWMKVNPKFAHRHLSNALSQRAKELRATLKGDKLEDALHDLDLDVLGERAELEHEGLHLPVFEVEIGSLSKSFFRGFRQSPHGFHLGQVPSPDALATKAGLKDMPPDWDVDRYLETPIMGPRDITRNLGMTAEQELGWAQWLEASTGFPNEIPFRQALASKLREVGPRGPQGNALMTKALKWWRDNGLRKSWVSVDEVHELRKAEAQGGRYYRRTTSKSGRHRYFYDKESYERASDAHPHGPAIATRRIDKTITERLTAAGRAGVDVTTLRDLAKRYDPKTVATVIKGRLKKDLKRKGRVLLGGSLPGTSRRSKGAASEKRSPSDSK